MKSFKLLLTIILCAFSTYNFAQTVADIKAKPNGQFGEFTEWTPMEVASSDGSKATIEYRLSLTGRTGVACNYLVEVRNQSDSKIDLVIVAQYYDKLVKGKFKEDKKASLKPGKSISQKFIAQGCKKDKGVEAEGYEHCMNCEFLVTIIATK